MTSDTYIIRGGVEGFDRLKVLSRVMHPSTSALLDRVGVGPGMDCLDVGCGSGDVVFELARRVGGGRVVGADFDEIKLSLARQEAEATGANVQFHLGDATALSNIGTFDLIHARFLLTHLVDPATALAGLVGLLRPGGLVVVEDIDFSGYFCYPDHPSHRRYVELYTRTVESRGPDPNIGPRLPALLTGAGLSRVQMLVVQPMSLTGETKLIPMLTMKTIADAAIAERHTDATEVERLLADLVALSADPATVMGMPRVVQAWGRLAH